MEKNPDVYPILAFVYSQLAYSKHTCMQICQGSIMSEDIDVVLFNCHTGIIFKLASLYIIEHRENLCQQLKTDTSVLKS